MNVRLLLAAGALGLLLAFGSVAGACKNGGGALTLEEFFQRVDELDNEFEARSAEIDAEFEELSEEEALDQGPDLLGRQAELVRDFIDGLSELDPPEEASDLLEEAVSAGRNVADTFDGLVAELKGAQSLDDLFSFFEDPDFTAARERFSQVCFDAEQLAADNGITVDLNCEDESGGTDGGDTGALEDYFQQLDAAENELRSGQDSIAESFAAIDDSTPPDEVIAAFEESKAVVDDFVAGMQDIDPPPEAAAAHEETIAAFQVVSGTISDAIDLVEGGGTAQEVAALLSSPDATEAETALDATCNALQSLADSNGIAVDLRCEE